MAERKTYDVVIIGGGHNGLVCAAYLAWACISAAPARTQAAGSPGRRGIMRRARF